MITSTGNPYVKRLRELAVGKADTEYFIVEGEKQIAEIGADWTIESYAVSESYAARGIYPQNYAIPVNPTKSVKSIILKDFVFEKVSNTVTPQGIIAVCKKKDKNSLLDLSKPYGLYLICDRVADPGNMGTIIRNAHAFGCDCLMISSDSVDVYGPKIVRASAGSLFHVNFIRGSKTEDYINELKACGVKVIATQPHADQPISCIDLTGKTAIVIGNEAHGISESVASACDGLALIPMPGGSESLNAAVACGIVLYEAARQRLQSALS